MISISEFENRIIKLLKNFKRQAKILACYLLDKDGFIIASEKEDFLNNLTFNKKVVAIYTAIETLSHYNNELMNFRNKRELISFGTVDGIFNDGFMVLVQSIGEKLVFLAILPTIIHLSPVCEEFDKIVKHLSLYLLDSKNRKGLKSLYTLV